MTTPQQPRAVYTVAFDHLGKVGAGEPLGIKGGSFGTVKMTNEAHVRDRRYQFVVDCSDDSMSGAKIDRGDRLAARERTHMVAGMLVIADTLDGAVCRRIEMGENTPILVSVPASGEPIRTPATEHVQIRGEVFQIIKAGGPILEISISE